MCFASPSGQGVFQVQIKDYQHIVDINARTCDCRRWQLTGVPCCHAISCLRSERIPPESVLANCYSMESFKNCIWIQHLALQRQNWVGKGKWAWSTATSLWEKKVGRPPKSSMKQPHEVQGKNGPRLTRHGVVIHCKYCGDANHNSASSRLKRMGFSSEEAKELVPQHMLH